jgi:hypothetical protein
MNSFHFHDIRKYKLLNIETKKSIGE